MINQINQINQIKSIKSVAGEEATVPDGAGAARAQAALPLLGLQSPHHPAQRHHPRQPPPRLLLAFLNQISASKAPTTLRRDTTLANLLHLPNK